MSALILTEVERALISSGIGLFIFVAWWFLYPPEDSA